MFIPLGDPVKPSEKVMFLSCHFVPLHCLGPQRSPDQKAAQRGTDLAPGHTTQKDARQKMVQNPTGINSNRVRRCTLWAKSILGETV